MQLTFKNGEFILHDNPFSKIKCKTIGLKAAVGFRRYADKVAERVLNRSLVTYFVAPSAPLPAFLDPHQKDGVNWILTRSRSYLAHAPGAGKTCESIIATILAKGDGPGLYIVPPDLTLNWEREVLKWTEWTGNWPSCSVIPQTAKKAYVTWDADFIICPDSMLTKTWVYDELEKLHPKLIAVDEASRFKEATSERTKALFGGVGKTRQFYGLVQNARHAVLLDGSPMPNRPMELWAPVYAMAPETIDFQNQHEFGVEYCNGHYNTEGYKSAWDFRGASNTKKLQRKLQENFMHVVPEEKLDHPERKRSLLFMTKDPRTAQMKKWDSRLLSKINLNDIDEDMSRGEIALYRQDLGLKKVDWVSKYVEGRLANKNESILIFAWHREVCRAIANRLKSHRPGLVIGGTTGKERERIFKSFQERTCRVVIGNIMAMGRGHNLQSADRVVFAEYSWSDELNKQCEKRASRKGSTKSSVRCDYVVVPSSLDEVVLNTVFTKAKNVKRIIG